VDAVANQSLAGLLARLDGAATLPTGWWAALSLVALAVGLQRARLARAAGDEVTALTLVGLTGNLVSPVSWTHHLVFLPVAVLVLADAGLRHRRPAHGAAALAVYATAVVSPIWLAPDDPLLGNAFTLMMVLLVLLLPVTTDTCGWAGHAGGRAGHAGGRAGHADAGAPEAPHTRRSPR
jgi:hypothetical protein